MSFDEKKFFLSKSILDEQFLTSSIRYLTETEMERGKKFDFKKFENNKFVRH